MKNKMPKEEMKEEKKIEKDSKSSCECEHRDSCEECKNDDNMVKELQDTISELQNKLLYKDAEFVNFRRRKEEETATMLKYASQDLILDIIKSVDNFERAIESIKNDNEKDNEKILAGIEMIYNELKGTLEKYGVTEINEVDVPFDASIHHAVMTDSVEGKENDHVLEIMMKGYILKERVIRPAMVKVNQI